MSKATVLVVDDEDLIRWSLRERLQAEDFEVLEASTVAQALKAASSNSIDLILLDNMLPDGRGLEALPKLKHLNPQAIVVMLTGQSSIEQAVEAMRAGAWHYARKPLDLAALVSLLHKALETTRLRTEVDSLRKIAGDRYGFSTIIGNSPAINQTRILLQKVARTQGATILLGGETGTGKDLAALVIHHQSDRCNRPFMNITCSALQESLLESELFGHERGAFTDAKAQKKGLLENADGGTVFLDEIGEMSLSLQAKMLRFMEEKAFKRVGGAQDVRVDVRVVAATNRDLHAEVQAGRFREDLYYRLKVLPVVLPPVRERAGDVPLLVEHFVQRFAREFHKPVRGVARDAMRLLEAHRWPGNVRELKNAVERAVLMADEPTLTASDFLMVQQTGTASGGSFVLPHEGLDLEKLSQDLVRQAIERTNGNQSQAARLLSLSRDQLRNRLEKLGLLGSAAD